MTVMVIVLFVLLQVSAMANLVGALPDILEQQMKHEDAILKKGCQLSHTPFLQVSSQHHTWEVFFYCSRRNLELTPSNTKQRSEDTTLRAHSDYDNSVKP